MNKKINHIANNFKTEFWKLTGSSPVDLDAKQNDCINKLCQDVYKVALVDLLSKLPNHKDLATHNFENHETVFNWDVPADIFDYAKDYGFNQALDEIVSAVDNCLT